VAVRATISVGILLLAPASGFGQDTLTVAADNAPVWPSPVALEEELRLGTLDGAEHEVFGRVVGVVGLADGTTFVADGQVPAIYRFGPAGDFLGQVGREGAGPGEYRRINEMTALSADRIVVQDVRGRKGIVYQSDGTLDAEFRFESGLNSVLPTFYTDRLDRAYVKAVDRASFTPSPTGVVEDWDLLWIRMELSGEVVDTIRPPPEDREGPVYTMITPDGPRYPYTVETVSTISPRGYLVWGRTDEYAFFRRLSDGRIVRISRHAERLPVNSGERGQFEEISAYFEDRGDSDYPPVPDVKPFFRVLSADIDGRIWVQRYTTPYEYAYTQKEIEERGDRPLMEWREVQVYDVFEPEGRYLGRVELPRRTRLAFVRDDRLWAIELGELEEPYVVRYRLRLGG
jgi:hypothetical protein